MKRLLFGAVFLAAVSAHADTGLPGKEWHGAQWIGAGGNPALYSQYLPVFRLDCSFESDGDRSTVFFGANDRRLGSAFLNKEHVEAPEGSSFIAIEIDDKSGKIRLKRRNYTAGEDEPTLLAEADLRTKGKSHDIGISCSLGNIEISVDGESLIKKGVNPYGNGGDYMAYPVLADVGLASDDSIKGNFTVSNFRSPNAVLTETESISATPATLCSFRPKSPDRPCCEALSR